MVTEMKGIKAVFAVVALATIGTGCVDADQSLKFTAHTPLVGSLTTEVDPDSGEEVELITGCAPQSGEALTVYSRLTIDLAALETFNVRGLLESQLEDSSQLRPIGADYNHRTNQNNVLVERAVIEFPSDSNQGGFSALDEEFDQTYNVGTQPATQTTTLPLIRSTNKDRWVSVVDGATGGSSTAIVPGIVNIRYEGAGADGSFVESAIVRLPFDVCNGCGSGVTPDCVATN